VRRVWGVETSSLSQRFVCCGEGTPDAEAEWRLQLQQRHPDSYADCNTHFNAHTNSDAQTLIQHQTAPEARLIRLPRGLHHRLSLYSVAEALIGKPK
jgi:hypothetical protein